MTQLEDRLRRAAQLIPAQPPADLAVRVRASVAGPIPNPSPPRHFGPWLPLAAAAGLAVAVLLLWPRGTASSQPAPVLIIAPVSSHAQVAMPSLVGLVPSVPVRDPARRELAALEADLAAAARTVRAALPF